MEKAFGAALVRVLASHRIFLELLEQFNRAIARNWGVESVRKKYYALEEAKRVLNEGVRSLRELRLPDQARTEEEQSKRDWIRYVESEPEKEIDQAMRQFKRYISDNFQEAFPEQESLQSPELREYQDLIVQCYNNPAAATLSILSKFGIDPLSLKCFEVEEVDGAPRVLGEISEQEM